MGRKKPRYLTRNNTASLSEFLYYSTGYPPEYLCKLLQRHPRTIHRWKTGQAAIPIWAVATLRLRTLEVELRDDEMGLTAIGRELRSLIRVPRRFRIPPANDPQCAIQLTLDIPSTVSRLRFGGE